MAEQVMIDTQTYRKFRKETRKLAKEGILDNSTHIVRFHCFVFHSKDLCLSVVSALRTGGFYLSSSKQLNYPKKHPKTINELIKLLQTTKNHDNSTLSTKFVVFDNTPFVIDTFGYRYVDDLKVTELELLKKAVESQIDKWDNDFIIFDDEIEEEKKWKKEKLNSFLNFLNQKLKA